MLNEVVRMAKYTALNHLLNSITLGGYDYSYMPSDSRNKGIPNYAIKRNRKIKGWQKKGK